VKSYAACESQLYHIDKGKSKKAEGKSKAKTHRSKIRAGLEMRPGAAAFGLFPFAGATPTPARQMKKPAG